MLNPQAIKAVQQYLANFAATDSFESSIESIYGNDIDRVELLKIRQEFLSGDSSIFPPIEIRTSSELNGASGAFAAETGKIYLSQEFLDSSPLQIIVSVLLEEYGHFTDTRLNIVDTPGEEGAIFSAIVQGKILEPEQLQQLKTRDDNGIINLDGEILHIEQASTNPTSGGFEGSVKTIKLDSQGGGIAKYSYNMYGIPDRLELRYEGKDILDTNFVSGSKTGEVEIPKGSSDELQIILTTNNQGTAWDYQVDTGGLSLEPIDLSEQSVSTNQWIKIPATGAVDGNIIKIKTTIKNSYNVDQTIEFKAIEDSQSQNSSGIVKKIVTIKAGESQEVTFDWDTSGYAWDAGNKAHSDRKIKVSLNDLGSSKELDSQTQAIKVIPKPVVLLHGLWSNSGVWSSYANFLKTVNSDWAGFAVDNMDTGKKTFTGLLSQPKTIDQNAQQLNSYIKNTVENKLNAQHIDLVAHSLGGLISRQYINSFMPNSSSSNSPFVSHLLTLGTPNGGSPYATTGNVLGISAVRQLTTDYVTKIFNTTVIDTKYIPISIHAGDKVRVKASRLFVGDLVGDGVVPIGSARDGYGTIPFTPAGIDITDGEKHTEMPGSQSDFTNFVLPRLALDPSAFKSTQSQNIIAPLSSAIVAPSLQSLTLASASNISITPAALPQTVVDPQVFFDANPALSANGSVDIDIPVPTGSDLAIAYMAPSSVGATLFAPDGTVVAKTAAGSPEADELFRSFSIAAPTAGTYKLHFEQQGGDAGNVLVSAEITGNPLSLNIKLGQPDNNKQVQINATLTNAGAPLTGATVEATLVGVKTASSSLTLFDDGQHGDGKAGDGIYGTKTASLTPDGYNVNVKAQGSNFLRIASDAINIPGLKQANLSLRQLDISDPGIVGQNVAYTFQASNIGPDSASGVNIIDLLPGDVDFVSASTGGSFDPIKNSVTFHFDNLTSNTNTSVDLVVKRKATGLINNTAMISAIEQDPDLTNNSLKPTGADLVLTTTDTPTPVNIGDKVTYNLIVTNNGPDQATSVILTDILPSGIISGFDQFGKNYINIVSSQGSASANANGLITANLATLKSGQQATVKITGTSFVAGKLINKASVTANEDDSNTKNNSLSETTAINSVTPISADLTLVQSVDNSIPKVGDSVTFTIALTNKGPGIGSSIKVKDILPSELNFISATPEQGTYDSQTGVWDVGNMKDNLTRTLKLTSTVNKLGAINTAEVIAVNEADPNSTPNNNNLAEDDLASITLNPVRVFNDFSSDGKSDIFWRNDYGSVALWQMDGSTTTSRNLTSTSFVDSSWTVAGTGDFNGDGKYDVLWRNTNGAVDIWTMNGSTVVSSSLTSTPTLDSSWKTAGTGDFNGDGKSDILWRNTNGAVAIWAMDGSTVKSSTLTSTPTLDNSWKTAGTGDFNGDGKSDILWRNDDGSVALWQMNGANITSSTLVSKLSSDWKINGTGDFNGDGKSDILWRNDDGRIALWQMNGANITSSSLTSTPSLDQSWQVAGIDDYNGDGKSDILWRKDSGSLAVWQMNGSTVVSSSLTSIPADSNSWKVAAPIL